MLSGNATIASLLATKPETAEPEPLRTWHVTFHRENARDITAHEHEVTTEGDVIFTTYEPEGEIVSCSLARGSWVSVELKPTEGEQPA